MFKGHIRARGDITVPRAGDISTKGQQRVSAPSLPWLTDAIGDGFVRGGVYLLAGEPGIGKTTVTLQILGDLSQFSSAM